MSLLKQPLQPFWISRSENFTFHYVSIKTQTGKQIAIVIIPLHSTMSLLKQLQFRSESQPELPLHSTMSLLKRRA